VKLQRDYGYQNRLYYFPWLGRQALGHELCDFLSIVLIHDSLQVNVAVAYLVLITSFGV
jgi:hypothetical protein